MAVERNAGAHAESLFIGKVRRKEERRPRLSAASVYFLCFSSFDNDDDDDARVQIRELSRELEFSHQHRCKMIWSSNWWINARIRYVNSSVSPFRRMQCSEGEKEGRGERR